MAATNWKNVCIYLTAALLGVLLVMTSSPVRAQSVGLRIMPLGDSITQGYRSTTGNGYRGPLWKKLIHHKNAFVFVGSQRSGPMFDPNNEGYDGYRINPIAALTNKELALYHPNIVLLDAGINDLGQNHNVATAPARLAALIDQIIAADPTVTVLVAQLIPNGTPWVEKDVVAFNAALPEIVQARVNQGKHVALVSMSAFTMADLHVQLHPNDVGYRVMADAWDAAIQQALAKGWVAPIRHASEYEIKCVGSALALSVSGDSVANSAPVVQEPYTGSASQFWNLIPTSNGYFQIFNANSGADLNVSAASKASGTGMVLWPFGSQGNDQWRPVHNANGSYTFTNLNSGLALDDPGGTAPGKQFDQSNAIGGAYQEFRLIPRRYLAPSR